MVVISDTTAITNLYQVKLLLIVKELYGQIIIPEGVYEELSRLSNQKRIIDQADWITIQKIKNKELRRELLKELDQGEAEAITLAIEIKSDLLVIDEQKGRKVSRRYGLRIIGVLGILINAKKRGIISNVKPYMDDLREKAGFHISEKLYSEILKRVDEEE
ncbi:MAG: DUF3368 domain-containing protein [Phaeodactylibacter sp.]|nr:DUF3368 domain-containing protein [Phaeodactylibacter sp.]